LLLRKFNTPATRSKMPMGKPMLEIDLWRNRRIHNLAFGTAFGYPCITHG
jgi:hypothetical protein